MSTTIFLKQLRFEFECKLLPFHTILMTVYFYFLILHIRSQVRFDFNNFLCMKELKHREFKSKVLAAFVHLLVCIHVNKPQFIGLAVNYRPTHPHSRLGDVHKVRHAILANFDPLPPPVTLCHTSRDPPPRKHVTHLGPPRFLAGLVQKTQTKAPNTNSLSIVRRGFCPGFLSGGLLSERICPGWVLSVPPSVRIHLLQQNLS